MKTSLKSAFLWAAAALLCITALSLPALAAETGENTIIIYSGGRTVVVPTGTDRKEAEKLAQQQPKHAVKVSGGSPVITENPGEPLQINYGAAAGGINYTVEKTADGQTIYVFEGKKYVVDRGYGKHKLSGYCPESSNGSRETRLGQAKAGHTVAAKEEILGCTVLLAGSEGPYPHEYDGMYVVEDTGGYYIEQEGWFDIWFESLSAAMRTTDAGWNYADVFIMRPYDGASQASSQTVILDGAPQ